MGMYSICHRHEGLPLEALIISSELPMHWNKGQLQCTAQEVCNIDVNRCQRRLLGTMPVHNLPHAAT